MLIKIINLKSVKWFIACLCILLFTNACNLDLSKTSLSDSKPSTSNQSRQDIPDNKRDLIRAIQKELNASGYKAGPVDGLMGNRTRKAIKTFQSNDGIKVDGEPSAKVLLALMNQDNQVLVAGEEIDPVPECEKESDKNWYKVFKKSPTSVVVDCTCQQLVEPFELSSNVEAVTTIAYGKSKAEMEKWLNNILKKDYKPDMNFNDVKKSAKHLNWMPLELEKEYGVLILEKRKDASDLQFLARNSRKRSTKNLYQKVDGILAELISTLPSDQPYEFDVRITSSLEVNAEAIPGGTIFISRGALNQGLGYYVLGHELAHVSKRHTTKAFQSRLIDSVETAEELKSLISEKSTLTDILDRTLALNKILIKYNQGQELQSDACAVRMLSIIPNTDTDNQANLFIKHLDQKAKTKPKQLPNKSKDVDFLGKSYRIGEVSSHPTYPERISQIDTISNQMNKK